MRKSMAGSSGRFEELGLDLGSISALLADTCLDSRKRSGETCLRAGMRSCEWSGVYSRPGEVPQPCSSHISSIWLGCSWLILSSGHTGLGHMAPPREGSCMSRHLWAGNISHPASFCRCANENPESSFVSARVTQLLGSGEV